MAAKKKAAVPAAPKPQNKLDVAVEHYINLRDEIAQRKKAFAADLAPLQDRMDKIEAAIMAFFQKNGLTSAKTPFGTPYMQDNVSVTVADRDAFIGFVMSEGAWEFIENKANKTAVKQYVQEHEELPPGISMNVEQVINIRRS